MRNTQLDSSMPRPRRSRGQGALPLGTDQVPVRYLPPILATLASAIFLVLLFGLLTYVSFTIIVNLVTDPTQAASTSPVWIGGCGIASLLLLGITLYFLNATRIAALDLGGKPVHFEGKVVQRHHGRGRGSGYWVVISPEKSPGKAEAVDSLVAGSGTIEVAGGLPGRERGFVSGSGSFGSQLIDVKPVTVAAEPKSNEPLPPPPSRRKLQIGEVNLRVDKRTYQELGAGDHVEAVYSPHLQHVYYVRKEVPGGEAIILRNLALI